LLGELVGVQRTERILVLQLRGQQRQKRLEITASVAPVVEPSDEPVDEVGSGVVPETTRPATVAPSVVCHVVLLRP